MLQSPGSRVRSGFRRHCLALKDRVQRFTHVEVFTEAHLTTRDRVQTSELTTFAIFAWDLEGIDRCETRMLSQQKLPKMTPPTMPQASSKLLKLGRDPVYLLLLYYSQS